MLSPQELARSWSPITWHVIGDLIWSNWSSSWSPLLSVTSRACKSDHHHFDDWWLINHGTIMIKDLNHEYHWSWSSYHCDPHQRIPRSQVSCEHEVRSIELKAVFPSTASVHHVLDHSDHDAGDGHESSPGGWLVIGNWLWMIEDIQLKDLCRKKGTNETLFHPWKEIFFFKRHVGCCVFP